MTTLPKIEKFFNTVKLTPDDDLFVGIDVHKKSYHVALFLNDAPAIDFVMPAKKQQLTRTLKPTAPALRGIVYETGPTGYGLARSGRGLEQAYAHQTARGPCSPGLLLRGGGPETRIARRGRARPGRLREAPAMRPATTPSRVHGGRTSKRIRSRAPSGRGAGLDPQLVIPALI